MTKNQINNEKKKKENKIYFHKILKCIPKHDLHLSLLIYTPFN